MFGKTLLELFEFYLYRLSDDTRIIQITLNSVSSNASNSRYLNNNNIHICIATNCFEFALLGNTVTELGFSVYQNTNLLLGSREHVGFLFIRQTLQCLQKIILPPAPFLIGLLIHR